MDLSWEFGAAAWAAAAAVLALVANIISAVAAAKSSDRAAQAEKRALAAERNAAIREIRRTAALIEEEAVLAADLLQAAIQARKSNAQLVGAESGSRVGLDVAEREARVCRAQELRAVGERWTNFTGDGHPIEDAQLEVDAALVRVRAAKEWAVLELGYQLGERGLRYPRRPA